GADGRRVRRMLVIAGHLNRAAARDVEAIHRAEVVGAAGPHGVAAVDLAGLGVRTVSAHRVEDPLATRCEVREDDLVRVATEPAEQEVVAGDASAPLPGVCVDPAGRVT